jgi:excisionase family DNA binding protein
MASIRIRKRPTAPVQDIKVSPPTPLNLRSIKEAALYCKVSTQTIRRAIKSGALQIYRAGKQIRIDEADLIKYLSQ